MSTDVGVPFVDAGLRLLDRQLRDVDGMIVGKVDDLELTFPEGSDGPPYVTAILTGPGALSGRFGGRFGAWLEGLADRLRGSQGPPRISFGVVKRIDSAVHLALHRSDLDDELRLEWWVRDHVIGKVPGAEHAPE